MKRAIFATIVIAALLLPAVSAYTHPEYIFDTFRWITNASGSYGVNVSNTTQVYWSTGNGTGSGSVTQVNTGSGLTGGPITTTGTVAVNWTTAVSQLGNATALTSGMNNLSLATIATNIANSTIVHAGNCVNGTVQNLTASGPQCINLTAGPQGPAGINGTNGANGTNGVSVSSAVVLVNGSLNVTLSNGTVFISGNLTGPVGAQGAPGTNGTNGLNGSDGAQGPQGPAGPAGTNGTNGINGTNGVNGSQGPPGTPGINGTNGNNFTYTDWFNQDLNTTKYVNFQMVTAINGSEQCDLEPDGIHCYNTTSYFDLTNATFTYRGSGVCTAGNGLCTTSETDPVATAQIALMNNLSLATIAGNLGNYSAAILNNVSIADISNLFGNWSGNASSYALNTYVQSVNNYTNANLVSILGNWSSDKANYAATALVYTLGNYSGNASRIDAEIDEVNATALSGVGDNPFNQALNTTNTPTFFNLTVTDSLKSGNNAVTLGLNNIAFGQDAWTEGEAAFAIGKYANASTDLAVALGKSTVASNTGAIAIGADNLASGEYAVAIGDAANALGTNSVAIASSKANNTDTVAIGASAIANGYGSIAIGTSVSSTGDYAIALGRGLTNAVAYSVQFGANSSTPSITISPGSGTTAGAVSIAGFKNLADTTTLLGNATALTSSMNNLSIAQIVNSLGNWSANQTSYATNAYVQSVNNYTNANLVSILGNYTANGMPKAGGTFTGNVTIAASMTIKTCGATNTLPCYYIYSDTNFWICRNTTNATIINSGNTTITCA